MNHAREACCKDTKDYNKAKSSMKMPICLSLHAQSAGCAGKFMKVN